jgi:hypothetical protein
MKTITTAVALFVGLTGFSFGGDCANGFCNRPSGRVLSVTKEVVRLPRRVVTGCTNGKCTSRSVTRIR